MVGVLEESHFQYLLHVLFERIQINGKEVIHISVAAERMKEIFKQIIKFFNTFIIHDLKVSSLQHVILGLFQIGEKREREIF